jgi:small-conductance mechanosensitive channel/quercetin dioxygenase-like cupin family protein
LDSAPAASIWARLLDLVASSPFTGTWTPPATALLTLLVLFAARRTLPPEDRHHGRTLLVFLIIGFLVGLVRTGFYALGAGATSVGVLLGIVTKFCVAVGAVGTAIIVFFVLVPGRLRFRVPSIVRDSVQAATFVMIAFAVLSQSGINVASLITTAGVLTAVIGLALQNTIANVFAGLMLNMDRELSEFDWVQVGDRIGQIVQIRWRSTILRTIDGDIALVPNSQMLSGEVYNYSRPSPRHRLWLRVTFDFRYPPNLVREMLVDAAREAPGVLSEPAPDALVSDFGESGVVYSLRFWIDTFARRGEIESEVRVRIWYAARRAGFEIPFPTRTIHMVSDADSKRLAADDETAARLRAVEKVDLFTPLEPAERARLAEGMRRVHFARGERILRQGDPGDSLYIIASGQVRVSLEGEGAEAVATLNEGDFFGETSLMTGAPRSATCTAASDVVLFVVDRAIAREVLTSRPGVAEEMSAILAARQAALAKLGGERAALGRAPENRKRLLTLIRDFFDLK